jgi:hypothetical protein
MIVIKLNSNWGVGDDRESTIEISVVGFELMAYEPLEKVLNANTKPDGWRIRQL